MNQQPLSFEIGSRKIGVGQPVFVIAEIGINHGGDPGLCGRMIEEAANAGADAVKLQTINIEESYVQGTGSYREFKGKDLSDAAMANLMGLTKKLNIVLFSTPGDFESLDRLVKLGVPAIKISSGLMTNVPLIAAAARQRMPLIISTGLAYEGEIAVAADTAKVNGAPGVALLKCTALYPALDDSINLMGIPAMAKRFALPIGYSDHTLDALACTSAVAVGATIIEKHFTLDRSLPGADHHISMEPEDFTSMVNSIRRLQKMRGDGRICPVEAEEQARPQRHRCLVARRDISAGEVFDSTNIALKRSLSGNGLSPSEYEWVLGKKARFSILRDEPISKNSIEETH